MKPFFLVTPADEFGCGYYRMRWPFESLQRLGLAQGVISPYFLDRQTLQELDPDVLICQRVIEEEQITRLMAMRKETSAKFVFEIDDLITDMPVDNKYASRFHNNTADRLKRAISLCDRLVVSSPALAVAYGSYAPEVVVCPNSLPNQPWASLSGVRRGGARPRVGWAGHMGHLGDLKVLYRVVRATSHLVDWVFLGAVPEVLKRYSLEVHTHVSLFEYPAKLASLDLELAVAPLEIHPYNDAKSHLRLLELGAMGFPVICSAGVGAFDYDLPVTRVENHPDAWIAAIVAAIADRDALANRGDILRGSIHADWLMDGRAESWATAWGFMR